MSKLVPNLTNTARVLRGGPIYGAWSVGHTSVCLTTKALCLEVHKYEPHGRFFADKRMIQFAGGPWFIQHFKEAIKPRLDPLRQLHVIARVSDVSAKDLFSYRTCNIDLDFNHNTIHNPIALQIVQKAQLFAIVDEELERQISAL